MRGRGIMDYSSVPNVSIIIPLIKNIVLKASSMNQAFLKALAIKKPQ